MAKMKTVTQKAWGVFTRHGNLWFRDGKYPAIRKTKPQAVRASFKGYFPTVHPVTISWTVED